MRMRSGLPGVRRTGIGDRRKGQGKRDGAAAYAIIKASELLAFFDRCVKFIEK